MRDAGIKVAFSKLWFETGYTLLGRKVQGANGLHQSVWLGFAL